MRKNTPQNTSTVFLQLHSKTKVYLQFSNAYCIKPDVVKMLTRIFFKFAIPYLFCEPLIDIPKLEGKTTGFILRLSEIKCNQKVQDFLYVQNVSKTTIN